MILPIVAYGTPVLREETEEIDENYPDLKLLIEDMWETMYASKGVGLAAPQISESLRLFVAHVEEDPEDETNSDDYYDATTPGLGRMHVMINPKITHFSGETTVRTEGCLSLPGYLGDVCRSLEISIKYTDRHGQRRKLKTNGWMARVLQHEYDHLKGVLFIDKAEKIWLAEQESGDQEKMSNQETLS